MKAIEGILLKQRNPIKCLVKNQVLLLFYHQYLLFYYYSIIIINSSEKVAPWSKQKCLDSC